MARRAAKRSARRSPDARPARRRADLGGLLTGIGVGVAMTLAAVGSWFAWPGREPAAASPHAGQVVQEAAPVIPYPIAAPARPDEPPPLPPAPQREEPTPAAGRTVVAALPAPEARPAPPGLPPWRRHAVAVPGIPEGVPRIAIVIDDLGPNVRASQAVIALPGPLTLAFLPYAGEIAGMVEQARRGGHEILVHMPMEPMNAAVDPGPGALRISLSSDELRQRIADGLARFGGHVGLNNHMGSRFTADPRAMGLLMDEVSRRGLLFLDSRTTVDTVAEVQARSRSVPFVARDVFLDNDQSADRVEAQLAETERVARRKGHAVAIGHPHAGTRDALAAWLPQARRRGFQIVPVSNLVRTPPTAEARR